MRAVLLAAGRATRLRPLTDILPKCLLEVGGRSILARAVAALADHGIRRFTVVDGFAGDQVRSALRRDFPATQFRFVRNAAWETTNNAFSLRLAAPLPEEEGEEILLLDGDVVFHPGVVGRMLDGGPGDRLAVRTEGELGDEEMKVVLAPDGRIGDVGKHILPTRAVGESVGIAVFSPALGRDLFATLGRRMRDPRGRQEWYEAAFVELIERGAAIHPVDLGALPCMEIDTPDDLARARRLFGADRDGPGRA